MKYFGENMRILILLLVAVLGLTGCSKAPELHAVGIYEGHRVTNKPWPGKTSMTVAVDVDRPRKSVTLVLGSYDPVRWDISLQRSTEINKIVLTGYGAGKASVEINGEAYTDVTRDGNFGYAYQPQGLKFRQLVSEMPGSLGFERFDSYHGSYNAPETGFIISDLQTDDERLDPDYLKNKKQPVSPETDLRLSGVVGGYSGEFLHDGTLVNVLNLTPSYNTTVSADGEIAYAYTSKGIRQIFGDDEEVSDLDIIPLPEKNLRLGHFKTISLDEKRNRLLAIFQAGAAESKIMALDLTTERWREFGSTGRNEPNSLFYDAQNDRFLLSVSHFSRGVSIGTLNPESGQFQVLRELNATAFEGLTDLYDVGNRPAPYLYIVGLSGNQIVLATDGTDIFSRSRSAEAGSFLRIYVMDIKTGDVKLTYYE